MCIFSTECRNLHMHLNWLQTKLQKELPGEQAHAPYLKYRRIFEAADQTQAREAAVGIHLFERNAQCYFYLIERSTYDGQHSGQMAFPGGKKDPADQHLERTARRESEEELGIEQQLGTTAKQLTAVWIPVSGFIVTPFVIVHEQEPVLTPNPREVQQIIKVKLNDLLKEESCVQTDIEIPGGYILKDHPCFLLNDKIVWGATALILNELRMLLG